MLTIIIAVLFGQVAVAQDVVKLPDKIVEKTKCLNPEFLLYRPKGVDASKKAPLLIYLHGMAWRGRNIKLIKRVGGWGLSANTAKQKLLLVMPQCDSDVRGGPKGRGRWKVDDVNLLLEYVKKNYKIDEDRVYLAGYSMGGYGTWACATAYPKTFAAIAPIAGGGDPRKAEAIKHLPIWVFHGRKDTRVPHKKSQDMVEALKSKGAKKVKFTSYPDQGHNRVLGLAIGNPKLYKWLASHSRVKPKAKTRPRPKRPKRRSPN
jgi:predicted peptidase